MRRCLMEHISSVFYLHRPLIFRQIKSPYFTHILLDISPLYVKHEFYTPIFVTQSYFISKGKKKVLIYKGYVQGKAMHHRDGRKYEYQEGLPG